MFYKLALIFSILCWPLLFGPLNWSKLIYDDSYLVKSLDDRFPYLKLTNGSYVGPRDYFNFSHVFEPNKEYFRRVNLEEHLFDELRAMEISASIATMDQWHYSDEEDLIKSGLPEANEQQCFDDLEQIETQLERADANSSVLFERGSLNNVLLLRYLDTWARPPSETYHGHSYWTGSYRGCQMAELELSNDSIPTKFRYCWAKLRAKDWPESDVMVPSTSIRAGVCLPKSCDTRSAAKRLDKIHKIMLLNFSPLHRDRFNQILGIYCLPNQTGLTFAGRLYYRLVLYWVIFVVSISIYAAMRRGKLPSLLNRLTLQENFRLFNANDDEKPDQQVDLRPLGLVRIFASIGVCVAHCACSFGWVFNASTFAIMKYRSLPWQLVPSLLKALDLYLVIGGLLSSFLTMKRFSADKRRLLIQPGVYLVLITVRYLRLAPMMVLVLAFMKSIYPHLSDGPMWDYGTYKYSMQGQCQRSSWWRVLGLPIVFDQQGNSYLSECLSVSWYLIADLKIAFVVPLIIYLMSNKRKSIKWILTAALVLVSALHQYKDLSMQRLIYFKQFFNYGQLFGVNILSLTFGEPGYFSALNRLHAVVLGLLAGVQLHQYQEAQRKVTTKKDRNQKSQKWPFWMRGPFFWAAILWQVYDFFSPILVQQNYLISGIAPSEEIIKLAMVLKPRLDAIIFSIILLRLVTDLAPKLMQNSIVLYKLSKLTYCVFLIHTILISYSVSANEKSRPDTIELQFVSQVTFVISISFLISFPLHLLIESPIAQLISNLSTKLLHCLHITKSTVSTRGHSERKSAKNGMNKQQVYGEITRV